MLRSNRRLKKRHGKAYVIKEENVMCAICRESWVDKNPRILPCQHTFCLECLENVPVNYSKIKCSLCRFECNLPGDQVANLHKPYFLSSFERVEVNNDLCPIHNEEKILFCQSHNIENLCLQCHDENHSSCKIILMTALKKRKDVIRKCLASEQKILDSSLREIEQCQKELILKLQNDFKFVKEKMKDTIKKREKILKTSLLWLNNGKDFFDFVTSFSNNQPKFKLVEGLNWKYEIENDEYLSEFTQKSLDFSKNCSSARLVNQIRKKLEQNQFIEKIVLSENCNRLNDFKDICQELAKSSDTLREITVTGCDLIAEQLYEIGNLLISCSKIEKIKLIGNVARSSSNTLSRRLSVLRRLSALRLLSAQQSRETTMEDATEVLCQGLYFSAATLKEIHISACRLNGNHCIQIGKLLEKCFNIKILNLSYNKDIKDGIENICSGLLNSANTLMEVDFSNCSFDEEIQMEIYNYLWHCPNLAQILLGSD
ncbi:unnamed protein product [Dimorphilus gyrociliatus]|uniref:RING-type domain-containing protein n=1 Tax=Dimorphilus gyrociliatus TaxID=2664684 RepID=A0A7I8WEY1_9ANNE|nr:unnamed protein product [Dimorphilus gyrociliatus]